MHALSLSNAAFLSNFYWDQFPNNKRLFIRALETALDRGILKYKSASLGLPDIYTNGDAVVCGTAAKTKLPSGFNTENTCVNDSDRERE